MTGSLAGVDLAGLVLDRADELAELTEVPGEITRPYGSVSLRGALDRVEGWMFEAGLACRRDGVGSIIGRLGAPGLSTLVMGSHVDSVRNAGRYDGPLGVLAAIAAVSAVRDERLPYAVEVVGFADEEGLRYRHSYLASRAYAGLLPAEELSEHDEGGVSLRDAILAMGGDPESASGAGRGPDDLLGYLEVHIEQGPVLQAENLPIGIVTGIAGQSRGSAELVGVAGHAGNTPMALRRDALPGAAELVLAVEDLARTSDGLIATVGRVDVSPNVGNVIPGAVTLSYDIRHQDDRQREVAVEEIRRQVTAIAAARDLRLEWRPLQSHPAVSMSARLRRLLGRAVEASGRRPFELPSGAGHDAVSIAHLTDVAMLFVRCKDGISHHPDESVRRDDVAAAIDVATRFLRQLGEEASRA